MCDMLRQQPRQRHCHCCATRPHLHPRRCGLPMWQRRQQQWRQQQWQQQQWQPQEQNSRACRGRRRWAGSQRRSRTHQTAHSSPTPSAWSAQSRSPEQGGERPKILQHKAACSPPAAASSVLLFPLCCHCFSAVASVTTAAMLRPQCCSCYCHCRAALNQLLLLLLLECRFPSAAAASAAGPESHHTTAAQLLLLSCCSSQPLLLLSCCSSTPAPHLPDARPQPHHALHNLAALAHNAAVAQDGLNHI